MRTQWRLPQQWEDFEDMCYHIALADGVIASAVKYGRKGQRQLGVDIVGHTKTSRTEWIGLQCKLKTEHLGSKLQGSEIRAEYEKSKRFMPSLTHLIFATTSSHDVVVQDVVNLHNQSAHRKHTIEIWFREDLCKKLENNERVAARYYPEQIPKKLIWNSGTEVSTSFRQEMNDDEINSRLAAFFTDPLFCSRFDSYAPQIRTIILEAVDNALDGSKGKASWVNLKFNGELLSIEDNGITFNPFNKNFNISDRQHGLRVIQGAQHLENIRAFYQGRDSEAGQNFNELVVQIEAPFENKGKFSCVGYAETNDLFFRSGAYGFIQKLAIPNECDPYTLRIGGPCRGMSISAVDQVLSGLRQRLGNRKLRIIVTGSDRKYVFDCLKIMQSYCEFELLFEDE